MRVRHLTPIAMLLVFVGCRQDEGGDGSAMGSVLPADSIVLQEGDSAYIGAPAYLTVSGSGAMFVSDPMNGRVLEFNRKGELVRQVGRPGMGPGELGSPISTALIGDSLLAVSDAGSSQISLFDVRDGRFIRSVKLAGLPFSMQASGDTVWMSAMYQHRNTSIGVWPITSDSIHYIGPLPREYLESPALREWEPYATVLRMDDEALVGFTGHAALFALQTDGSVTDTLTFPNIRRAAYPTIWLNASSGRCLEEEVPAMQSSL